jgi:hypothetical protein
VSAIRAELLPRAHIVTPNIPEAEVLSDSPSARSMTCGRPAIGSSRSPRATAGTPTVPSRPMSPAPGTNLRASRAENRHQAHARNRLYAVVGDCGQPRAGARRQDRAHPCARIPRWRDSPRPRHCRATARSAISGGYTEGDSGSGSRLRQERPIHSTTLPSALSPSLSRTMDRFDHHRTAGADESSRRYRRRCGRSPRSSAGRDHKREGEGRACPRGEDVRANGGGSDAGVRGPCDSPPLGRIATARRVCHRCRLARADALAPAGTRSNASADRAR